MTHAQRSMFRIQSCIEQKRISAAEARAAAAEANLRKHIVNKVGPNSPSSNAFAARYRAPDARHIDCLLLVASETSQQAPARGTAVKHS
jgi:hypothetical protein